MNTPFSKNKEKRHRTSSSEANSSFVKNVTSRVSGLLPATITKWFSSPSSSNANGSVPTADATDSSTEDEAPESPVTTQPPAKRMRYNFPVSPNTYNNFNTKDVNVVPSSSDADPYGAIQSPPGKDTFRRETNFVSTPIKSNDDLRKDLDRDTTVIKSSQHTVLAIGQSVAAKRKSLFETKSKHEENAVSCAKSSHNTKSDSKQPYFKPVLLGSPFYYGRTMYGGAAASCYINQPNIKGRKVAVVNNDDKPNDTSVMSLSARRVMDLLEHYSSPLAEARRISQYTQKPINESLNDSTASTSSGTAPKVQELHVPNIASVLRLKQKSRLMDMTSAARQILASHSSSDPIPYPTTNYKKSEHSDTESNDKLTTKVKRKLTRPRRGDTTDLEETVAPVELPSATLQIAQDKLPKFSFGIPSSTPHITSTPKNSLAPTGVTKQNLTPITKDESKPNFQFSNPVPISCETSENIIPTFTFGSPEREVQKKVAKDEMTLEKSIQQTEKPKKDWECPDCWVKNKSDADKCVCCNGKRPLNTENKPAKCVQCFFIDAQPNNNKCTNCLTKPGLAASSNNINKIPVIQWKCEDCWVSNDEGAEKCICCGASKKASSAPEKASTHIEKDWKCEDCWVSNKSSVNKCVACGGAKPGAKSAMPSSNATATHFKSTEDFKNITKTLKSDKWECPTCLVSNNNSKTMCACCGADKELSKGPEVKFNFGMNTNATFKFGIDPKVQEASLAKKPDVTPEPKETPNVEKSEANNNVLAETPSFTFTLPAKKSEDKVDIANTETEAPKTNFNFGFGRQATTDSGPSFTPISKTVTNKLLEFPEPVEEKEKPQEVPSVDISKPQPANKTAAMGCTPIKPPSSDMLRSIFKPASKADTKEVPSNSLVSESAIATTTAAESSQPQSTFAFSVAMKPSTNFFASPTTTTATNKIFAPPAQSIATTTSTSTVQKSEPAVTTASTVNMFAKTNLPATATVSLFQKPEQANAAALPPSTADVPTFTFGTNAAQNNIPPFTFGINKTESSSMFKPTFGSTVDSGASSNKFGISAGSALGASNTLTVNSLGGSKGLSVGNSLTGGQNTTSGNGLPTSAPLGGNGFGNALNAGNALGGNGMNTGNALGSNGINASNALGSNELNAGITLGSNSLNTSNTLGGNDLNAGNILGGNGMGTGTTSGSTNNIFASPLSSSTNALQSGQGATPIFGQPLQKENMWSATNNTSSNLFVSNASTNSLQKTATFSFGSTTPFNATNTTSAFGNNTQSSPTVFGMPQNQSTQNPPPLFAPPVRNQSTPNIFGTPAPGSNSTPTANIFGTPNVGAAPTFGTPNPSIPSFEAPSLTPASAPAFNFGAPQSTGIFGFGQQPQQQQPTQPGVYNFAASGSANQVQFNMGSAPTTAGRKLRKAVRRSTQR